MPETIQSHLSGVGRSRLHFEDIDQRYHLKIRSFIRLCMTGVFITLEQECDLESLRAEGVIPIMFFLQFESEPRPLSFGGKVETPFQVRLCESGDESATSGPDMKRLLLDMTIDVKAQEGMGDPQALGGGDRSSSLIHAGHMRGVHVLSRPLAPAEQRRITKHPSQFKGVKLHRWDEPFPTIEGLHGAPEGFAETGAGPWQEHRSVWGLQNTDINQHVNVHEYIVALENHFTRMLFGAGLPTAEHRIDRTSIIFRKPFFSGAAHGLRGRLFISENRTVMLGGIHALDPEGGFDERVAVGVRMEGSFSHQA